MNEREAYSYTILRYVHDVVAGEFLNVGVVMHVATSRTLLVKTQTSIGRLRSAFPDIDLHAFRDMIRSVEDAVSKLAEQVACAPLLPCDPDARSHATRVLPDDDSSLQWSPVGHGVTANATKTLERLFVRYVAKHDKSAGQASRRLTEDDIRRKFRRKLSELGVEVPFEAKLVSGDHDQITFHTAWKNGSWHAYEPVSLDLADEQGIKDKVRRWRGHLSAVNEGVSEEVQLHFLVGRPRNGSLIPAYMDAKAILSGSPFAPEVVDEEETDEFARTIKEEYLCSLEQSARN